MAEELETELKASAIIDAVVNSGGDKEDGEKGGKVEIKEQNVGVGKKIVIVDHQDR